VKRMGGGGGKICVKYVVGRSREENWQAEEVLHVWTKREMYKAGS